MRILWVGILTSMFFGFGAHAHAETSANSVVWFDLTVSDQQRAERFYSDLFGWKFVTGNDHYTLVEAAGTNIGGLYLTAHADKPGGVSIYFQVADLEATLANAKTEGATVVLEPMAMPNGRGSMALFLDLDGNAVGLMQVEEQ